MNQSNDQIRLNENFQKLAVAETPGKIPHVVYADAADHIANKNPNISMFVVIQPVGFGQSCIL